MARLAALMCVLSLVVGCGGGSSGAPPRTLTVPSGGSIQDLVDQANDGDSVVVPPGVWTEHVDLGGKKIVLRGTDPADPLVVASTVLDAGGMGRALTIGPPAAVPFALRDGAPQDGALHDGTLHVEVRGLTLRGGGGVGQGGGVLVDGTRALMADCIVEQNEALFGGGICGVWTDPAPSVSPRLELYRCTVRSNTAEEGGGIALRGGSNVKLIEVHVELNTATAGDGGGCVQVDSLGTQVSGSVFVSNAASGDGGGFRHRTQTIPDIDSPWVVVSGTRFEANTAGHGGGGAALQVSSFSVLDCEFVDNEAGLAIEPTSPPAACGVADFSYQFYDGGGMVVTSTSSTLAAGAAWTLGSSTFFGNTAQGSGGAVAAIATKNHDRPHPVILLGNTFQDNEAVTGAGGAVFSSGPALWVFQDEGGATLSSGDLLLRNTFSANLPDAVAACDN